MVILHLGTTNLVRLSAEDLVGLEESLTIGRRDGSMSAKMCVIL